MLYIAGLKSRSILANGCGVLHGEDKTVVLDPYPDFGNEIMTINDCREIPEQSGERDYSLTAE